jgi:hypothetical protein
MFDLMSLHATNHPPPSPVLPLLLLPLFFKSITTIFGNVFQHFFFSLNFHFSYVSEQQMFIYGGYLSHKELLLPMFVGLLRKTCFIFIFFAYIIDTPFVYWYEMANKCTLLDK